ncbi:replication initiation negative regulator SeqA [Colwellia sp. M166]|uniref:replication initiation negative regulator SeqA n=1 Tax=Colwellia sp. M166 TaxID=2583805 RepID=UPI00211DB315|nr:replication initiation negative regulator SeqA [Colwellia sp. M166]UUO24814.1 replication initiation negative regulator SeqA [Colwellia sp. M166]|tara:strand:- start:33254 stop:33805 length:552 start_codon:yes stop_codon:yes gene_type:complete
MKNIEIDEELYQHIASNTQYIGESASSILRRLIKLPIQHNIDDAAEAETVKPVVEEVVEKQAQPAPVAVDSNGTVFNYINKEELAMQRGAVGRFLLILAALYRVHNQHFSTVCNIRGRDRLYFAGSEAELTASGSSTKPRQIPDSPFWVITNSNTTRKKMMLTEVGRALGYNEQDVEDIRDLL